MILSIDSIDGVLSPLGSSGRVKYTCFDVSPRYLVLGANTGSLYFFERKQLPQQHNQQIDNHQVVPSPSLQPLTLCNENLIFSQILSFNDIRDSILSIRISPTNENVIAVATNKVIYIVEPNLMIRKEKEKIIIKMTDHPRDTEITVIEWSVCGQYLFSGDDGGNIFCCSIPKARRSIGFFFSAELVTKCDSRIVQLDIIATPINQQTPSSTPAASTPSQPQQHNITHITILSSTLTKSSVINYSIAPSVSGKLLSIIPIGKKQRENTKQGACFHPRFEMSIYASRPGKRLWLADFTEGKVLSTMNFKSEDGKVVTPFSMDSLATPITGGGSMIFSKLLPFGTNVVSWDEKSILLIDVEEVEVLEWRLDQNLVQDLCILDNSVYVLHGQNRILSRVYHTIPHHGFDQPIPSMLTTNVIDTGPQPQQQQPPVEEKIETVVVEESNGIKNDNNDEDSNNTTLTNSTNSLTTADNDHDIEKDNGGGIEEQTKVSSLNESNGSIPPPPQPVAAPVVDVSLQPPTATTTPPPAAQSDISHNRRISKENLFSEIQITNDPLVSTTSVPRTKIIKKKKAATTSTNNSPVVASSTAVSGESTVTPPPSATDGKPPVADDSSSSSSSTPSTTTKRKVTVIKKKLVKKEKIPGQSSDSQPSSTTSSPLSSSLTNITNPSSTTGSASNSPSKKEDNEKEKEKEKEKDKEEPITTTPPLTPQHNTTTTTNIQQPGSISSKASGIFKGINTSSIMDIKQLAGNTIKSIQKQTEEIKSEITNISNKILLNNLQHQHQQDQLNNPTNVTSSSSIPITVAENASSSPATVPPPAQIESTPQHEPTPYEVLEKLTKVTYDSLVLYRVKRNEQAFLPMLQIWAQALHKVDIVPAGNDMINELITSCFLLGINIAIINEPTGKICGCWNESVARSYIERYFSYMDVNKLYRHLNQLEWDSCIEKLLEMDSFARHSSRIIQTLNQLVDTNDPTCLSVLERNANDVGLLFRYIDHLLELKPVEASIFYANQYPSILPRNIFHFVNKQQQPNSNNNLLVKSTYLNHLMTKYDCRNSSELVEQWFQSNSKLNQPDLNQLYLQSNNNSTIASSSSISTSTSSLTMRPKIKGHMVEWKQSQVLINIINGVIANEYICSLTKLEEICRSIGFFEGLYIIYYHLYRSYGPKSLTFNEEISNANVEKLIHLVVATDNKEVLVKLMENNINHTHWSILLIEMSNQREFYKKQQQSQQKGDDYYEKDEDNATGMVYDISEEFIARLMGRSIGPLQSIELLNESQLFDTCVLPSDVFAEWIRNGKWSLYHRKLISHEILSRLDSYLWTKKPMNLSPQIWSLVDQDLKYFNHHHHQQQMQQQQQKLPNQNTSSSTNIDLGITPQFFEDSSFHWGTETELQNGSCPICTLPLIENPESSFLGVTPPSVIIFPYCGHSYHQTCIEEQGCPLCSSKLK